MGSKLIKVAVAAVLVILAAIIIYTHKPEKNEFK